MISRSRAKVPADSGPPPQSDRVEHPLSEGQRALWFLQRLRPDAAAWNLAAAARVRGQLDPQRLQRAFAQLAERHESLRLSFHETPAGPVQRWRSGGAIDFREEDARRWSGEQLRETLQAEADRPFDLTQEPLLRVCLLRTGEDDVLFLAIHHLVADLGSLAILVRELGPLYAGEAAGPVPPLQILAAAERLETRLAGRAGERLEKYWRKRLSGELPICELPTDHPRPPVRTFRGGSRTGRLGRGLTEHLRWLAGEHRATLFTALLAGLDVLLVRASGETDLLVGSPTSGRVGSELDGTVGYLVNPVVLRSDLSGNPNFRELLERVRSSVLGALRHQEMPFARLVEQIAPERDPARSPLFQVMLAFQRAHLPGTGDLAAFAMGTEGAEVHTGPLHLTSFPFDRHFSQLDLELTAAETSRGTELALTYNADLFEPATAQRLLKHFVTLLEAATEDPDRRIGELPLLSKAERQQLAAWNETASPLPDRLVDELFEEQAARTPAARAVSAPDGHLTYGELSSRSNDIAQALADAGLRPEEPGAVWTERGAFLLAALLGILKAGGVYFPLNPDHPTPRLRRMLERSKARLILASDSARCRELFPDWTVVEMGSVVRQRSLPESGLDSAAYLLFTSGSTGEPKGVVVTHRGLLNHLLSKVNGLGMTPSDRVAQTAPQSFDISIWQLLAALLAGATVEVIPDSVVREPDRLLTEIDARGISILQIVPSLLAPLVEVAEKGAGGRALRRLITIGETLSPEVARRWIAARPGVPLVNCYGPTECADGVSDAYLDEVSEGASHTSIGRPIPNLRLHVLSPELEPQPIGFPGEVCIAGAGVGRGYLDDPAQTAAAFLPDPFSPEPGRHLYRTGDLGRRRTDGELEVLGRIDHQVKVRGVRVEPGEVEAALAAHPGVRAAIVALRQDRLIAWWTGDPAAEPELREHLRKRLPEAMIPSVFRHLSAVPLTPHGKVDRRALPDSSNREQEVMDAPADQLQQLLMGIFRDVLGRERVGLRDNFFELGGHSLLAVQAMSRARTALGVDAPAGLLFEEPSVVGLARRLRSLAGAPSLPPITRGERDTRIPLSFAQERLWFLHRLAPDSPAYNMPGLVRLAGALNRPALAAALTAVVGRQEALRATFHELAGEPWQEIGAPFAIELPLADLSALAHSEQEAQRLAVEEAKRPFDLGRGPLLRAFLIGLPSDHRLVINVHHIAADGASMEILAREVAAHLGGSVLPALSLQHSDYGIWEREQIDSFADQLAWWLAELGGGLLPLGLPLDRPGPSRNRGARVAVQVPADTSRSLRQLARTTEATPFMVLLAAFKLLLHRLTGQNDVRMGTVVANRPRVELGGLIGLFTNTLVLRTRFGSEGSFRELIERVRETAIGAYLHQELPFEKLIEELHTPLFQAMLLLQPPRTAAVDFAEIDNGTSKLELTLSLRESADHFEGWIEYDTDLFDLQTVQRWAASFQSLLAAGVEDPERTLDLLPLLEVKETAQIRARKVVPSLPAGPIETAIAEIWSGVLGDVAADRNQSFFDLGGHSLLATRVISRINAAFDTDLSLRAFFDAPTLAGLARLVSENRRDRTLPPFRTVPRDKPLAPSFAQERLWVMDRLTPNHPVYNVFQALDLHGPLNEPALAKALDGLVERHEALRTHFVLVQGRLMQEIEPHRPSVLRFIDLRGLGQGIRAVEIDRLTRDEARRPFDLLRGPVFRFTLIRLGETEHRVLLTLHHVACDGWSLQLLAREAEALYAGEKLPALPFQYADYADWQRRWPAEALDGQLAWWTGQLAGLATLEVPTDRPRPPVQSFRGGLVSIALPLHLSESLQALAHDRSATAFMLMLAAWQILLHRLTGQTDVAVGSPAANRGRPEIEGVVGFFVNTLVLRADLSGEPAFAEALGRVREAALGAYAHEDLPFERLVAELAPERDLSRSPVVQVAFSFEEAMPPLELGRGLRGELVDVHTGTSKDDLWLQVEQGKGGWRARAEYAAELFDSPMILRWLGHLQTLLGGIVAAPEARVSDLPLLSATERQQLQKWAGEPLAARQTCVHRFFEEWARTTPAAPALLTEIETISYAELDIRANRLARHLLALGIGPEKIAAACLERSAELSTAMLAVLKAGGVWLPLDPSYPSERMREILEDAGAVVVISTEELASRFEAPATHVLLDRDAAVIASCSPEPLLAIEVDPRSLAYIIYTSGSTGRPKGVGVSHEALAAHLDAVRIGYGLGPGDRTLQFASPGFDVSVEQVLSTLTSGAAAVVQDAWRWHPHELTQRIPELGLTFVNLPTAYWNRWSTDLGKVESIAPLRLVLIGGEAMPAASVRSWMSSPLAATRLLNAYGPTEAVVTSTLHGVQREDGESDAVSIGRPIPGRSCWVVDRFRNPQPLGVPGELLLGGPLSRGYVGSPDLTAERFIPDPFSGQPGARLYRTGDRACWLPGGSLQFLGRTDQQVKIRGFRVEPGEIAEALRRCPAVREAFVALRENRPGDERLAAWYVPEPGQELSTGQLQAWLRERLPEFMVPSSWMRLYALPLTPSGKIDHRALPTPPLDPVQDDMAPRTPLQTLVAGVFSEVLGISAVPLDVRFFDLGGNSLMATQVVTLLQDVLPIQLDLRKVIEGPTVARLAEALEEARAALPDRERHAMAEILMELERSLALNPGAA